MAKRWTTVRLGIQKARSRQMVIPACFVGRWTNRTDGRIIAALVISLDFASVICRRRTIGCCWLLDSSGAGSSNSTESFSSCAQDEVRRTVGRNFFRDSFAFRIKFASLHRIRVSLKENEKKNSGWREKERGGPEPEAEGVRWEGEQKRRPPPGHGRPPPGSSTRAPIQQHRNAVALANLEKDAKMLTKISPRCALEPRPIGSLASYSVDGFSRIVSVSNQLLASLPPKGHYGLN